MSHAYRSALETRLPESLLPLVRGLEGRTDRGKRLVELAGILRDKKHPDWAKALIDMALTSTPEDTSAQTALRGFWNLPAWHFSILNDAVRADAYEQALRETLRPDDLVLEIGTGSGILALLAARAGARQVITCETNPYLADCACEIIRRNGYDDRIRVINRSSKDLLLGEDLPRRADVLLGDLFTGNLYPGGGLPLYQDAQMRLLVDDARIIPALAHIQLCLVSMPALASRFRVARVSGFDLSDFNRFLPPAVAITPEAWTLARPRLLSEPVAALRIDFSRLDAAVGRRSLDLTATAAGRVDGLCWWVWLDLNDTVALHGAPDRAATGWMRYFHPFPMDLAVESGSRVSVMVEQDLNGFRTWWAG